MSKLIQNETIIPNIMAISIFILFSTKANGVSFEGQVLPNNGILPSPIYFYKVVGGIEELKTKAKKIRRLIVLMLSKAGSGHPGGRAMNE
jgi:hypothetical protein